MCLSSPLPSTSTVSEVPSSAVPGVKSSLLQWIFKRGNPEITNSWQVQNRMVPFPRPHHNKRINACAYLFPIQQNTEIQLKHEVKNHWKCLKQDYDFTIKSFENIKGKGTQCIKNYILKHAYRGTDLFFDFLKVNRPFSSGGRIWTPVPALTSDQGRAHGNNFLYTFPARVAQT